MCAYTVHIHRAGHLEHHVRWNTIRVQHTVYPQVPTFACSHARPHTLQIPLCAHLDHHVPTWRSATRAHRGELRLLGMSAHKDVETETRRHALNTPHAPHTHIYIYTTYTTHITYTTYTTHITYTTYTTHITYTTYTTYATNTT